VAETAVAVRRSPAEWAAEPRGAEAGCGASETPSAPGGRAGAGGVGVGGGSGDARRRGACLRGGSAAAAAATGRRAMEPPAPTRRAGSAPAAMVAACVACAERGDGAAQRSLGLRGAIGRRVAAVAGGRAETSAKRGGRVTAPALAPLSGSFAFTFTASSDSSLPDRLTLRARVVCGCVGALA